MKYSIILALVTITSSFQLSRISDPGKQNVASPLSEFSEEWNDPKYEVCNTAKNANYMTSKEKEVIYILNLARMNPQLFCSTVVEADGKEIESDDYTSLVNEMKKMQPLNILEPDMKTFQSAQCHAITSGKLGFVGHTRQTNNCKKMAHFYGECCSYGETIPVDIILQLLIDDGVPGVGHRKICFTDFYTGIGVSIQPHKRYGSSAVLDFYY
jgi:uncharacterized protein YkwD